PLGAGGALDEGQSDADHVVAQVRRNRDAAEGAVAGGRARIVGQLGPLSRVQAEVLDRLDLVIGQQRVVADGLHPDQVEGVIDALVQRGPLRSLTAVVSQFLSSRSAPGPGSGGVRSISAQPAGSASSSTRSLLALAAAQFWMVSSKPA